MDFITQVSHPIIEINRDQFLIGYNIIAITKKYSLTAPDPQVINQNIFLIITIEAVSKRSKYRSHFGFEIGRYHLSHPARDECTIFWVSLEILREKSFEHWTHFR
jgi:hypothetical protein